MFLLAFLLTACATKTTSTTPPLPPLESLTLDEKLGQLFVVGERAVVLAEDSERYRRLRHHVRDNKVGGILWFVSNVYETAHLTRRLQAEARVPLLVSADLEAGIGMRFLDTTWWPWAMAVAATGEPRFAETLGRRAAIEGLAIGINHIYGPVADVNVDPDNPVINTRSFGEDPRDVGRYVAAFVRGVQSQPVLATAKHFPGHGDTHTDTHRSLPVLDVDRARLERVELIPFRAAIDAGVASVMLGHLAIPSIDPTPVPTRPAHESATDTPYAIDASAAGTMPASLSRPVIEGLLRRDLGFDGLVAGDAFDMGGLVAHFDAGEAAVRAIEAGSDLVLHSPDTDAAIAAVKAAVRGGRISEARIDESVRRILRAKARVQLRGGTDDEIFRTVDNAEHRLIAAEIATRAITLVREERGVLPLRPESRVVIVNITDAPEASALFDTAAAEVRRRAKKAPAVFSIDSRTRLDETQPILDAARNADVVILALSIRAVAGGGRLRMPEAARALAAQLRTHVIGVAFGSPYVLRDLPDLTTYLCAYGAQPVMQRAAVAALYGEAAITGKLPVTIPGLHARGEGLVKNPY